MFWDSLSNFAWGCPFATQGVEKAAAASPKRGENDAKWTGGRIQIFGDQSQA
jgi:hypothetical protein